MDTKELANCIDSNPLVVTLKGDLKEGKSLKYKCEGLKGSAAPMYLWSAISENKGVGLFIANDQESAAYFYDDIQRFYAPTNLHYFPSSHRRHLDLDRIESENVIQRTDVLNAISSSDKAFVVTYPEALAEKIVEEKTLQTITLQVRVNDKLDTPFLQETLEEYGFERVDFVYEPGQYSIRGSIVDIFSFSNEDPYRIDFFGDEVDSIRIFDIESQISKSRIEHVAIVPNIQDVTKEIEKCTFFDFIGKECLVIAQDISFIGEKIDHFYNHSQSYIERSESDVNIDDALINSTAYLQAMSAVRTIEYGHKNYFKESNVYTFNLSNQPLFHKNFDLLAEDLHNHNSEGYRNLILSSNTKQLQRIRAIFNDKGYSEEFEDMLTSVSEGFVDHDLKLCIYTDHQIFERYHRFRLKSQKSSKLAITLKELQKLSPGDYIVHIDHGVGQFAGLVRTEENGKVQESLRLVFKGNDSLLVSIHALHRISKYKDKDGTEPKLNKLGTSAWQKMKSKTKSKVKDIAKDLIALYAKRKQEQGFAFTEDSYLQQELEASFIYEDTPDQNKATLAVKQDMEKQIPMDRLVCGDVGFGKTEVAIRAAFKAVCDSKQVAVLVPTTILAFQHYKTFIQRLEDLPCNVAYLSRMRKPKEVKEVLQGLKEGKIDIVIGTHKLVGKDVAFKDLGLLIIDEEQKFGVAVKEKLKKFKVNVDTLTLTATPIPRTLQFSLMGARDLSVINTPPPNRYPILTEVHGFNEEIIKESIEYELERGGQVFFINNRVQNIHEVEAMIQRVCPGVRTIVGHGQMDGASLEKVMLSFIAGEYDVLIATTIIESGLDIPNANTIIINHAHQFGLSELHQLRGRVGRSNKKAFCYLLAPPMSSLPAESRRRLEAIEEFSELGSGFNISMQDLDIRGAGNMLGGEQSGFIADIGFETYQRILNEAIHELKTEEFKDIFDDEKENDKEARKAFMNVSYVQDCQIETDMELLFPSDYVENTAERMILYNELDNIERVEDLNLFIQNTEDRFGKMPEEATELTKIVQLRWAAQSIGIEKIRLKKKRMILDFISDPQSPFYSSAEFTAILQWLQQNPGKAGMKQEKDRIRLTFIKIFDVNDALEAMKSLSQTKQVPLK
ncbi:transcription-repair coupling factor [Halosquirtibacter xylanolyticus]|uniref:transcription-repair coupling factor n=1 Tax=Halosquirtibacter xylanolyticus TaxID=3374599 RepID=UPI00374A03D5|nr:transcription-repair coupling factor [Prolixibacteraceae bacterium]